MVTFGTVILALPLLVSFFDCVYSKKPELTPFGKKVKSIIPSETYEKIFATNYKNDTELRNAIKAGTKNFYDKLGLQYDNSTEQEVEEDNEKLGIKHLNRDLLCHCQTYAIDKAFRDFGILNKTNIDELAQKYVDELNESAKSLNKDDITSTFTALTTAIADFLIYEKVTSKEQVEKCEHYFIEELKKYQEEFNKG